MKINKLENLNVIKRKLVEKNYPGFFFLYLRFHKK